MPLPSLDATKATVSRIFNAPFRSFGRLQQSRVVEEEEEVDDDVGSLESLSLSGQENILRRCASRCIAMMSPQFSREFPDVEITPRLIFENPTIDSLSEAIHQLPRRSSLSEGEHSRDLTLGHETSMEASVPPVQPFTQLLDSTGDAAALDAAAKAEKDFIEQIKAARKGPIYAESQGDRYFRITDGMECVLIPGRCVRIGNDGNNDPDFVENEGPSHDVELSGFLMDIEPVSIGAYARFLNMASPAPTHDALLDWCLLVEEDERCCHLPLALNAEGCWQAKPGVPLSWPMILVSWYGANAYSLWAHGEDWRNYRSSTQSFLPTEAQWEYAARGEQPALFPWGDAKPTPSLLKVCWDMTVYDGSSHVSTPLEQLPLVCVNVELGVSPFGLRHMAGNVWQWCRDTYAPNFYLTGDASKCDACNCEEGSLKSERGGSWVGPAALARSSSRRGRCPDAKGRCLGFRCCAPAAALDEESTAAGSEGGLTSTKP